MKLSRCLQSHSVNALFSLEFHGAFSKCSTFAMSIFYSWVTAVRPNPPELALCPPHQTELSSFPALCYFSHKNILSGHNLDVREIFIYTLHLSYFLYICFESSLSMSSKICHPCEARSCYQPRTVCVLHAALRQKGSALKWGQSVSHMPLYNMKPMYTRKSLKVHFTEIPISTCYFKHFFLK